MRESYSSDMLRAIIDPEWAANIKRIDTWTHNTFSAESIHEDVALPLLGSLAVELSGPHIADASFIKRAASVKHIINLSAGQPAVETSTGRLLKASEFILGEDHQLTVQLAERNKPNSEHGADEPWFLPLSGVKIMDIRAFAQT